MFDSKIDIVIYSVQRRCNASTRCVLTSPTRVYRECEAPSSDGNEIIADGQSVHPPDVVKPDECGEASHLTLYSTEYTEIV